MKRIPIFDVWVRNVFFKFVATEFSLISIIIAVFPVHMDYRIAVIVGLLCLVIVTYLFIWLWASKIKKITLKISNSTVEVFTGDIFDQKDIKVIPFNEYFDTEVNDKIISLNSLNGKYINKYCGYELEMLDTILEKYDYTDKSELVLNKERKSGKKRKFKLGTVCKIDDYILTSFSLFDENNRAHVTIEDYITALMNLWNEIDIVYCGRSVVLPLLGSGITRFKGYENITNQELLEAILYTFKLSKLSFKNPSKLKIIIPKEKMKEFNLTILKYLE